MRKPGRVDPARGAQVRERRALARGAVVRVAVLGAGKLGSAMVTRLSDRAEGARASAGPPGAHARGAPRAAPVEVVVWTRTADRARPLGRLPHVQLAATPAECVRDAHFVLGVLADGAATRSALHGRAGALAVMAAARRPPLFVDASTSGRRAALELAELLAGAGVGYVDAAMSGTVGPALRGELVALVGGAPSAVRRARPLLDLLCRRVIHAGAVGQGQALKVVLNGVGAHHFVAFASMLALGERAGLPRAALVDAFTTGAFASPSYVGKRGKALARDWSSPDFSLRLAQKDVALNLELQREVGLALPVVRALARTIDAAVAEGLGDRDLFGIEELFERRARAPE